jgi:hypothetical protein
MRLAGLGDPVSDIQKKIDDLNAELLIQLRIATETSYTGQSLDWTNAAAQRKNDAAARVAQIQTELTKLTLEFNALSSAADAKETAYNSSPIGVANANKNAADNYRQQLFYLSLPGYDYGRGSGRRNAEYKGLGDIMIPKTSHSLFNLHNQDGLADLTQDILAGARVAVAEYKASGSSIPLPNIPGGIKLAGVSAPSWLTNIGKAVVSGARVVKARQSVPATNIATGGAEVTAEAPAPNFLTWGAAALAVGLTAYALKGKR